MTARLLLEGQEFVALNGGPEFKFTEENCHAIVTLPAFVGSEKNAYRGHTGIPRILPSQLFSVAVAQAEAGNTAA